MQILCSKCKQRIPAGDLNIQSDVALCRQCGETFSISQLFDAGYDTDELLRKPSGISLAITPTGWRVASTTRSAHFFLFAIFAVMFGPFFGVAMIGQEINKGNFTPFTALFATPFLLVSCFAFVMAMMHGFGRIVVIRDGDQGEVFTGVGSLGWRRKFLWTAVKYVREDNMRFSQTGSLNIGIRLVGPEILFGSLLRDDRRSYLRHLLRRLRTASADEYVRLIEVAEKPFASQPAG